MKKRYWTIILVLLILLVTYFSGPRIPIPVYSNELPELPTDLTELENLIRSQENREPLRKDNEARIIWHHDTAKVTPYSIVYLHGFAGSYRDGYPVNVQVADSLGANIFLFRMAGHGLIPPASLENFSPTSAWESALEALKIGKTIGKKVIIISTSTGGTLALKLAQTFPESVYALINLSPNIEDNMKAAFLLNSPWGYEITQLFIGDYRKIAHESTLATQYWDTVYTSKALVDLQVLVSTTMKEELFKQIQCPVLTLYYYENILDKDQHVEINRYPEIHQLFSIPDSLNQLTPLQTPKTHFLGSDIKSKDTEVVLQEILKFFKDKLSILN
ncbi:alpha/beta hydrolase [Cyclobacterium jeungdonense]|uniref:Alpha/beta fold hydrolase n=1 Tax=Cyclobacterium jeungdonense TaxID=708087 RepID=A0ABT8CD17_9BACT|nr:alpha/beta fold hydrolase [Cyclobacterium jeungdonense]MDN3690082.1 alpha/beta fold hydrolase [Cyclobacterium jeungdonense]